MSELEGKDVLSFQGIIKKRRIHYSVDVSQQDYGKPGVYVLYTKMNGTFIPVYVGVTGAESEKGVDFRKTVKDRLSQFVKFNPDAKDVNKKTNHALTDNRQDRG